MRTSIRLETISRIRLPNNHLQPTHPRRAAEAGVSKEGDVSTRYHVDY